MLVTSIFFLMNLFRKNVGEFRSRELQNSHVVGMRMTIECGEGLLLIKEIEFLSLSQSSKEFFGILISPDIGFV